MAYQVFHIFLYFFIKFIRHGFYFDKRLIDSVLKIVSTNCTEALWSEVTVCLQQRFIRKLILKYFWVDSVYVCCFLKTGLSYRRIGYWYRTYQVVLEIFQGILVIRRLNLSYLHLITFSVIVYHIWTSLLKWM